MGLWDNVTVWYTCKKPINNKIGDWLTELHTTGYDNIRRVNKNIYGCAFDCSYNHYSIIKTSYERGLNNILILEDDVKFCEDRKYFDMCLSHIPENYGICKLYYSNQPDEMYIDQSKPLFTNNIPYDSSKVCSTAAYCLDRYGMEQMIKSYENKFTCADWVFMGVNQEKFYYNNFKICEIIKSKSDINILC
jgi:GR25 family glycosyltransferase involved in LPS biosynthesis